MHVWLAALWAKLASAQTTTDRICSQKQAVTGLAPEACMRQQSSSLGVVCLQAWHHILLHGLHWILKHQIHHDRLDVLPNRGDIFALRPHTTLRRLISSSWLAQIRGAFSASNCIPRAGTALSAVDWQVRAIWVLELCAGALCRRTDLEKWPQLSKSGLNMPPGYEG